MNDSEKLVLLRIAVAAKAAYWDALRELEVALYGANGELTNTQDEQIEMLASGINAPEDAYTRVTKFELNDFINAGE